MRELELADGFLNLLLDVSQISTLVIGRHRDHGLERVVHQLGCCVHQLWLRDGAQREGFASSVERQFQHSPRVEAQRIGVAYAHVDQAVAAPNGAGQGALQRCGKLGRKVFVGRAEPSESARIRAKVQLGHVALVPRIDVDQTVYAFQLARELFAQLVQHARVGAEQLDLEWPRATAQIVEHVLQHLHELGAHLGQLALYALPQICLDLGRRTLSVRAQAHHDVTAVQLRGGRRP